MELQKVIDEGIAEVMQHESIQAANSAIALQALRSGTKGYQGEFIQVALQRFADKIIHAVKNPVCPHYIPKEQQDRCSICTKKK